MAFPASLDTFPAAATLATHDLDTDPHSLLHGNIGDALEAIEAKVGVDGSAVTSSLDFIVNNDLQPINDLLSALASLSPIAANKFFTTNGVDSVVASDITAYILTLMNDPDAATARTTLGLAAIASSGSASDLVAGTLPAGRFPALTGDITTPGASLATTLATVNSNVGSFGSATQVGTFTVNGKGLVTAAANATIAIASTAITDFLEATMDILGSQTNLPDTSTIQNTYDDTGGTFTQRYIGDYKQSVLCASIGNLTLSGTQTIDGISAGAGVRVLAKNQTAPAENGIYIVAAGAWARAGASDTAAKVLSTLVSVQQGTVNADTMWLQTTDAPITLGTTALVFGQVRGHDRQTFTGNGTWTKPPGVTSTSMTMIRCIGGGGGGGGGRTAATGVIRGGGGGGGAGGYSELMIATSALASTETVDIGAAGTSGAGGAIGTNDGATGGSGGNTVFGTTDKLIASGGFGGGGGTTVAGVAGAGALITSFASALLASSALNGPAAVGAYGGGGGDGTAFNAPPSGLFVFGALGGVLGGGGGGGGGITTGTTVQNGQIGGTGMYSLAAAGTAGSGATPGGAAGAPATGLSGGGGGGGGSRNGNTGGAGGAGGAFGGGGGGGGASNAVSAGGAGGVGAAGYCEVITWL